MQISTALVVMSLATWLTGNAATAVTIAWVIVFELGVPSELASPE